MFLPAPGSDVKHDSLCSPLGRGAVGGSAWCWKLVFSQVSTLTFPLPLAELHWQGRCMWVGWQVLMDDRLWDG